MVSAAKLIGILMFWAIIGITWAVLNEQVIEKIPSLFPEPVTQDANTWTILKFIWTISIILLAAGAGISILSEKGLRGIISSGVILFIGQFMLIFIWACFWNPVNVTIPSVSAGMGFTSNEKANLGIYDASFELACIGIVILSLLLGGSMHVGSGRRTRIRPPYTGIITPRQKTRQEAIPEQRTQKTYIDRYEPKYERREKKEVLEKQPDGTYKKVSVKRYHY